MPIYAIKILERITDFAYKLAMKAPDLNPEGDQIILEARLLLKKMKGE
jgi:hypothetical protein